MRKNCKKFKIYEKWHRRNTIALIERENYRQKKANTHQYDRLHNTLTKSANDLTISFADGVLASIGNPPSKLIDIYKLIEKSIVILEMSNVKSIDLYHNIIQIFFLSYNIICIFSCVPWFMSRFIRMQFNNPLTNKVFNYLIN